MFCKLRYAAMCVLAVTFVTVPLVLAQTTNSTMVGDVRDAQGGAIAGAKIVVTSVATAVSREVTTSEKGSYQVFPLNPGTYDVVASAPGFKTKVLNNVIIDLASIVKIDFPLDVGDISERVEVTANAAILQTQDASIGGTITGTEISRLPVNGRNYTRLIMLLPGTSDVGGSQSNGTFSGTQLVSVNGQRRQDNNFTMDGVDNNFMMMNSPGASPPMDSIQEFRVLNNTSAEFGRSAGSNVNIVIKSGSRNLHGSAYEYFRNDKLDANDFFANRNNTGKVPFRQNQYGFALGGPVVIPKVYNGRDKTFWFFNWEGYRRRRGSTNISNSPVQAQRDGDFSGISSTIYDPFTSVLNADGSRARQPFAGNRIPQNRINPAIKVWLDDLMPLPNRPGLINNLVNTQPLSNDRDLWNARGDHTFSAKDSVFFRYSRQHVGQISPTSYDYLSGLSRYDVNSLATAWNHIFNPSTVLEVKFGYNAPLIPNPTVNTRLGRKAFLSKSGITMFQPDVIFDPLPNLNAVGEFGIGSGGGVQGDHVSQYIANLSKILGRHSLRFGVSVSNRHFYTNTTNPMDGNADFDRSLTSSVGSNTGSSFATMLLGTPTTVRRGKGNTTTDARSLSDSFYVQDDWRVTTKLTVNLGVRYEYANLPYDVTDRLGNLWIRRDPATGKYTGSLMWASVNPEVNPVTGKAGEAAQTFGFGRGLKQNNRLDFAPRIGLAYQIDSKTVVRSAYGIFYNSTFVQELQDMRKFWPYTIQQVFSPNTGLTPDLFITGAGPSFSNTASIGGWPQNPTNRTPYSQQWNLTVQRQLMDDLTLDLAYVGSANKRQIGYNPINAAITPGPGDVQPRRLLPDFGDLDGGDNRYSSSYNSFRANLVKRFSKGLQLNTNYTWGKSLDNTSSLAEARTQNPYNLRAEWARSSIDLRHVFLFSAVYELPFGRGKQFGSGWNRFEEALFGGWNLDGILRLQTGGPVNPSAGEDRANVGRTYQRPDVVRNPNNGPKTPDQWFDKAAFQRAALYTYGNAGAYIIQGDGRQSLDISLGKNFIIKEGHRLELRGEFYNLPNHVNMNNPNTNFSSSSFGTITSATAARQIQLALRYAF